MRITPDAHAPTFADHWHRLEKRLRACGERLVKDLDECRRSIASLVDLHRTAPEIDGEWRSLEEYRRRRHEVVERLFLTQLAEWERRRPFRRAIEAIDAYEREIAEIVRSLPESIATTGPGIVAAIGLDPAPRWATIARLRRGNRSFPLRAVVEAELLRTAAARTAIESEYLNSIALLLRKIREPWDAVREQLDAARAGRDQTASPAPDPSSTGPLEAAARDSIAALREWLESSERVLAVRVIRAFTLRRAPRRVKDPRVVYREHWGRQQRALEAEIRLERALEHCEDRILALFDRTLASLTREHESLQNEASAAMAWLRERLAGDATGSFPNPSADVVPGSSRLAEIEVEIDSELSHVPKTCELVASFSPAPGKARWQKVMPRELLRRVYENLGREGVRAMLDEIEGEHKRLVQEIERAREVVAFGLEVAEDANGVSQAIEREALENALSLLEYNMTDGDGWRAAAEARIASRVSEIFVEYRTLLTMRRLGLASYLARQGVRRTVSLAARRATEGTAMLARAGYAAGERGTILFLVRVGWRAAPERGRIDIVSRPLLPEEFTVDLMTKDLPAIYRRLFRFAPIEDPRFLIGRGPEIEAIAEARALWESGRPVSVLIVGERGSGKTSLINGALKRVLADTVVVRGEFGDRLTTADAMRRFLADLVGAEGPDTLESELAGQHRVIIIEELERSYLRQIGRYEALRELLRVIAATDPSTLWILAINQTAYRFLDGAMGLSRHFSHRINASRVRRDDLREAILVRHNLSGLRLNFAKPPAPTSPIARLKSLTHGKRDPEEAFFDALVNASGGVYRSAFEIWLGEIESAHAGVLYLKPILMPDLSPIVADLDMSDLFTLVAVLQHGSLTDEEHATIFQSSVAESRARLSELVAREILEPDPGRLGLRVRPEAARVVREALYRRNLL